jgi:hypothetical protein
MMRTKEVMKNISFEKWKKLPKKNNMNQTCNELER